MGFLAWSLMIFVTPLAAVSGSLPIFLGARVLLGIGEGVGMFCLATFWSPILESAALHIVELSDFILVVSSLTDFPHRFYQWSQQCR